MNRFSALSLLYKNTTIKSRKIFLHARIKISKLFSPNYVYGIVFQTIKTHNIRDGLEIRRFKEYLICCVSRLDKIRKNKSFSAIMW
jgi:hypothetical protein